MSHYNVNASVAKTLIQHLIGWVARRADTPAAVATALEGILATEISPELIPGGQSTEDVVGPYALQDFNLYYTLRYGLRPSKVAFLAWHAWQDGPYDLDTIVKWLRVFLWRFFQTSQFKRSAVPNGPKISSGGSLSPRGDWRMPSDASSTAFLAELETGVSQTTR